jgi:hypothetical protein
MNVQVAGRFSKHWARAGRLSPLISQQKKRRWMVITCAREFRLWLEVFQPSLRFVSSARQCLLAEHIGQAPHRRIFSPQSDFKLIVRMLKFELNSFEISIWWLI